MSGPAPAAAHFSHESCDHPATPAARAQCRKTGPAAVRRGRGRPAIGPVLAGVRLTAEMLAEIDELAAAADCPRSDVVRELLDEALAARRRKAAKARPNG